LFQELDDDLAPGGKSEVQLQNYINNLKITVADGDGQGFSDMNHRLPNQPW
jgi:hypothetical protein